MCAPNKPNCGCVDEGMGECARFTSPISVQSPVKGYVTGGWGVPVVLPGAQIVGDGMLGLYEDLYGAVDQYGNAAVVSYPGTWGGVFQAGHA